MLLLLLLLLLLVARCTPPDVELGVHDVATLENTNEEIPFSSRILSLSHFYFLITCGNLALNSSSETWTSLLPGVVAAHCSMLWLEGMLYCRIVQPHQRLTSAQLQVAGSEEKN